MVIVIAMVTVIVVVIVIAMVTVIVVVIVVAMVILVAMVIVTVVMVVMGVPTRHLQSYHVEFVHVLRFEFQYVFSLFEMEDHNHSPSWAP